MPQVDPSIIQKNTKFRAAYTDKTFNDKVYGLVRRDGVLAGLQVSRLNSTQLAVTAGAFLQLGLIVEILDEVVLPVPVFAFPWTIYAYSEDSQNESPVSIAVAQSGSQPAGVVILATTQDGNLFDMVHQLSIDSIRNELDGLEAEFRPRQNMLTNAGFELDNPLKGDVFLFDGPCVDGWQAENLSGKGPGSRVDLALDPTAAMAGGACLQLTSQSYEDPGASLPDGSTYPAGVYSSARIFQSIPSYREFVNRTLTMSVFLRLPAGHADQLHDLELAFYGADLGGPGFSDTPVDKVSYVIPAYTLTQSWQQFTVSGKIVNLNKGLAAYPLPAFPGIAVRIGYVNSEPDASPITTDKVLIDQCMLYLGEVVDPVFFPVPRDLDWLMAEGLFEGTLLDEARPGMSTDLAYVLGLHKSFRTKKRSIPSVGVAGISVSEEGAAFSVNSQANYDKIFEATSLDEYRLLVQKLFSGYRPGRVQATIRAQG